MSDLHLEYDDLTLRLEPDEGTAYRVHAVGPNGITGAGRFVVPFTPEGLLEFIRGVGLPRRTVRSSPTSPVAVAKEFGTNLFEQLMSGDVRDAYARSAEAASQRRRGLRLRLNLTAVPELMDVPWEFLFDKPRFLAKAIHSPVVRTFDLKHARPPQEVHLPLQVLGLISRPKEYDNLDVDAEREKLATALDGVIRAGLVRLRWLETGTLSELAETLAAPDDIHVLHFIGHGEYDKDAGEGHLVFENPDRRPAFVTGDDLGPLLDNEPSLRLVVLNACEGARTSADDPFAGVASSLIHFGLPAVIGMQFEITDKAAITFATSLYSRIADNFPIDTSVTHARNAIAAKGLGAEFGTPVLFLRSTNATLFEIDAADQPTRESAEIAGSGSSPASDVIPESGDGATVADAEIEPDRPHLEGFADEGDDFNAPVFRSPDEDEMTVDAVKSQSGIAWRKERSAFLASLRDGERIYRVVFASGDGNRSYLLAITDRRLVEADKTSTRSVPLREVASVEAQLAKTTNTLTIRLTNGSAKEYAVYFNQETVREFEGCLKRAIAARDTTMEKDRPPVPPKDISVTVLEESQSVRRVEVRIGEVSHSVGYRMGNMIDRVEVDGVAKYRNILPRDDGYNLEFAVPGGVRMGHLQVRCKTSTSEIVLFVLEIEGQVVYRL